MKRKKKRLPKFKILQSSSGIMNLGEDFPTSVYSQCVFRAAKHLALKMDIELPRILVIAYWDDGNLSTTCADADTDSTEFMHLLNVGHWNLVQRGLIQGTEKN